MHMLTFDCASVSSYKAFSTIVMNSSIKHCETEPGCVSKSKDQPPVLRRISFWKLICIFFCKV